MYGARKGRKVIGLSATFIAISENYNLDDFIRSKFYTVDAVEASNIADSVGKVYIYFAPMANINIIKGQIANIVDEIKNFYSEYGFELKPTTRTYIKDDIIVVEQNFRVVSVEKSVIFDKDHHIYNYEFNSKGSSGKGYYSSREIQNMAKRLSVKLGVPLEDIEMYMDDDNMPAYKINKI